MHTHPASVFLSVKQKSGISSSLLGNTNINWEMYVFSLKKNVNRKLEFQLIN